MKPINYERHCAECHPLVFDITRSPGKTVPHEKPEIVRGFLNEFYTKEVLRNESSSTEQARDLEYRKIPGRSKRPLLKSNHIEQRDAAVRRAELLIREHTHPVFGRGGCQFCHETDVNFEQTGWNIVDTDIPGRWFLHSRFHHEPHRMVSCTVCHKNVDESHSTGDVLLPTIDVCRRCHTKERIQRGDGESAAFIGARTNSVQCHTYHDHSGESLNGKLNADLKLPEGVRELD